MHQQGSPTESIRITEENILPLVEKHFQNVPAAHWAVLASGKMEPELEAIITGFLTDVIQTVSSVLLRVLLPKMREMSQESQDQAVPTVKADLGDSLPRSFCTFFNAEPETLDGSKLLTTLAEAEIEGKVQSYLSEAANQQSLPSKPAFFVNSLSSNIRRLGQMVIQTADCLKECLSPLTSCGPQYVQLSEDLSQLSSSPKSPESVKSLTESICDIVNKWSKPVSPKAGLESYRVPPPSPSRSAQSAAAEILNIILANVKTPERDPAAGPGESGAPRASLFDMTLIVDKVRQLTAPSARQLKTKSISKFARRHFDKIKEDLKKLCKKSIEKPVVDLLDPRSPQPEDAAWDFVLPGSIPDVPKSGSPTGTTQKRLKTLMKKETSEMNFETFKTNLEDLLTEMSSSEEFHERLETITRCSEVRSFSRELTDKLYEHLMYGQMYHIPIVPKGKCLSDSVISKIRKQVDGQQRSFSPEVLYSMTEDAVGRFVQQIFLLLIKETPEQAAEDENALGALQDIENLLKVGIPPPEDTKTASESSQGSDENKAAPAEENKEADQVTADPSYQEEEEEEKEEEAAPAAPESTEASFECLTQSLAMALLVRLLSKCSLESVHSKHHITEIKKKLVFLVCPTINSEECKPILIEDNLKDIINVVVRTLKKRYGSVDELLDAAMAPDSSEFDRVLIAMLKYELNVKDRCKKRSRIRRFFSACGNGMEKAVRFLRRTYR